MKKKREQGDNPSSKPNDAERPSRATERPQEDIPVNPLVSHSPIIVTGESSAGVEFQRSEYTQSGNDWTSSGLFLEFVEIALPGGGGERCHTLAADEVCLVEVICKKQGQLDKNITVLGGRSQSPKMNFDVNEYEDVAVPGKPHRRKRFNAGRKVQGLNIYRVVNGVQETNPFHVCALVPANGKCEITIRDEHVDQH